MEMLALLKKTNSLEVRPFLFHVSIHFQINLSSCVATKKRMPHAACLILALGKGAQRFYCLEYTRVLKIRSATRNAQRIILTAPLWNSGSNDDEQQKLTTLSL